MWTPLITALIVLLSKIMDVINSEQFQVKLQERKNEQRENEARKAIYKNDTAAIAALAADQHDRVLALCGGSGR